MKITSNDLKMAYQSHIRRSVPLSREACPPYEGIFQAFDESISPKKREKVIDHVVKCAYCFQEFELWLGLVRDENNAAKEISEFFRKKGLESPPSGKRLKIGNIISVSSSQRRHLWKLAAISTAILIFAGLFLISIRTFLKPRPNEERGRWRDQVRLILPIRGQTIHRLFFRWQKVGQAQFYQLEIFDETLFPVWKSPQISDFFYELPPEGEKTIEENRIYFWMVTAFLPDGGRRESPLEPFTLKR